MKKYNKVKDLEKKISAERKRILKEEGFERMYSPGVKEDLLKEINKILSQEYVPQEIRVVHEGLFESRHVGSRENYVIYIKK